MEENSCIINDVCISRYYGLSPALKGETLMIKNFNNYKQTCNIVCAILTLVLIVLMFIPFWVFAEQEVNASISDYLWFPTDEAELEGMMKDWTGLSKKSDFVEYTNDVVLGLFFSFVLGSIGVVLGGVIKNKSILAPLFGAVAGLWMTYGLLTKEIFTYGQNYMLHVVVAAVTGFVCLATLGLYIAHKIHLTREKNKKYKQYRA